MIKKTLFVCRNNIARSQLGAGYLNEIAPGMGFSAGTDVESRGSLVEDWDDPEKEKFLWLAVEGGIDIAKNPRTPLDDEALRDVGRVILMELEAVSELEARRGRPLPFPADVECWDVPDPHHFSPEDAVNVREIIKAKVGELATRLALRGGEGIGYDASVATIL